MATTLATGGVIQAVGSMSILYRYNAVGAQYPAGGNTVSLGGFKLNAEFITTAQTVQNSVIIPLLGGGSVQLTNDNKSGSITFQVSRISTTVGSDGGLADTSLAVDSATGEDIIELGPDGSGIIGADLVALALAQIECQGIYSHGATIACQASFNGIPFKINFEGCTVASCEPMRLAGNDVPTYNVVFNYHRWRQL